MVQPLEHLVRAVYTDDPAACFTPKGDGLRDKLTMARMQKAAAVMQFKLEGRTIDRNPDWGLADRKLLHAIDKDAGTIVVDGTTYPLKDNLHLLTGVRYFHLSNARIEGNSRNPSINGVEGFLGLMWTF